MSHNKEEFVEWLKTPSTDGTRLIARDDCKALFEKIEHSANERLAKISNRDLHPENKNGFRLVGVKVSSLNFKIYPKCKSRVYI